MKQRRINALFTIAALALTILFILTALSLTGTAAPRLERQPLESLTGLNSTEATESSVPFSAFNAYSGASVTQSPGTTSRISVASDGTQGNGISGWPSISAEGRFVAFHSTARNLVSGDTNGTWDIFVHDRQTGQTTRVSVASDGSEANRWSSVPSISANGRYVAFDSGASNLASGKTTSYPDVFVHDRQTGQTTWVSMAWDGTQGNDQSEYPSISADGRYVTFASYASNLVVGDTNGAPDVFVHDRQIAQTTRISVASDGTQGDDWSLFPSISADGRFVAFESSASNLVPGDTNDTRDVFLYDRQTGQTTRVSVASDGTQGNGWSARPSISADGRFMAFASRASNLVGGDTNSSFKIFVHDRQTGQTTCVSVASGSTQGIGNSYWPLISADGRFVAFHSLARDFVSGDTNSSYDVFVHDRQTGQTTRVSVASDGTQGNGDSGRDGYAISADGRFVAFESSASNLVPGDTNGWADVFVHDRCPDGSCGSPDFTIVAIEVTQAIQDLNKSVPLVAGKRTVARVHVRNQGISSSALVTGRLCGPDRCLAPDNPGKRIQVLANPDRARLDQSFYFELPPEWLNGDIMLTAEVNPTGSQYVEESNTANNSLSRSVTFEPVPPLKVKLFGVRYRTLPLVWQVHEPRSEDYDLILSWLRRAYPIAEIQWSKDVLDYGVGIPTCNVVNEMLLGRWAFDRIEGKIDSQTRYYGVVYDSGGFMRGCAMGIPSSIASGPVGTPGDSWAWDRDASYGDWYAGHELAHTYGRRHPGYCGGQERDPDHPPGDYPQGKISPADGSMYGFDIESTAVYTPTGWHDVMTYCDYQWISDFTYKGLRDYLVAQGGLATQQVASVGEHLIVLGVVNHTQNTAELHTLYRIPDATAPAPPISGTHRLKLLGAGDAVLADYPFTPGKDTSTQPGEDEIGLIGEIVPWVMGTRRVAVYSDTLELDSRLVSTNVPTVTVLSPNGGEVFTDTAVVSWSAGDADQDPLTYVLQYSIDNGATWQAVGVGITSTTVYTLDLTLLPGSDQGRVQVIASDGVNTGMDASDGAFHVVRKPPQARILSPAPGSSFLSEQMLVLVGEGTDVEDGLLADSALSWQSSLSGTLGTGRMLAVTGLITGTHVFTLTATDSDANTATATVQVLATFPEDVVPDCQVDIADIMQVASHWRCKCEDECYDPCYDLDGDCDIDIVDIMLVVVHWGETCEE